MLLRLNKKEINLRVKKVSPIGMYTGLMFRSSKTDNLLFEFASKKRHPIHSFFVFIKFLAVWLDENNQVLETRVVTPFIPSIRPKKPFSKLVEIPFSDDTMKIIELLVGKGKI
jgi:uncharacterized membrane protein (UPF0127 family)